MLTTRDRYSSKGKTLPNILVLRHSAGYEHSYLPDCEITFKQLGAEHGWKVLTFKRVPPFGLAWCSAIAHQRIPNGASKILTFRTDLI